MSEVVTGWDVGGAHLKVAQIDEDGRIRLALQLPCPLWQGIGRLETALDEAVLRLSPVGPSAVTMTGEFADLFTDRREGVRRLLEVLGRRLPDARHRVYAGPLSFLDPAAAVDQPLAVASANWHASAALAALRLPEGLLVDIGSTTSDLVPFAAGRVLAAGYSDRERLEAEELVYTGITRTPVMAVARSLTFAGRRQSLMAELFATMADVYRVLGMLPADADELPAADGGAKTVEASARRLARMLGMDAEDAPPAAWRGVAGALAESQLRRLHDAALLVLSRATVGDDAPLMGAGSGRFLVPILARRLGRPYRDVASLLAAEPEAAEWAARCLPAVAVAILLREAG